MEDAVLAFVEERDRTSAKMFFAKNCNSQLNSSQCCAKLFVWAQDWRGRIGKFKINVEFRPHYMAKQQGDKNENRAS